MPKPADKARIIELAQLLVAYDERPLVGLQNAAYANALAAQMVDSIRRTRFAMHIRDAEHSPQRSDPTSGLFDPLRAAVVESRAGDVENAYWLVFLATHFGKHKMDGWQLCRDIYGKLAAPSFWTWQQASANPDELESWLANAKIQMRTDGVSRRFSNHRKYESLGQIPDVLGSYIEWVLAHGSHAEMLRTMHQRVGQDPTNVFAEMYSGMNAVRRFGRLAKFDHLTMLGKLGISPIYPGSPFISGATGPLAGARLLFGAPCLSATRADAWTIQLGDYLGLGMQVMEDSICNWQKSPAAFKRFSG